MPAPHPLDQLGRRERQIMDILFRLGRATATEVQDALGEPISNSAVRGMLRLLSSKGYVTHKQDGPRYVYAPVARPEKVSRSALQHLVSTFFNSSATSAIAALIDMTEEPLSNEEYQRLLKKLKQAREQGDSR